MRPSLWQKMKAFIIVLSAHANDSTAWTKKDEIVSLNHQHASQSKLHDYSCSPNLYRNAKFVSILTSHHSSLPQELLSLERLDLETLAVVDRDDRPESS
jgi:hypothetical protein